ncbi:FYVE zinc finger domain-containing protein, partial [Staphylococcus aureus]
MKTKAETIKQNGGHSLDSCAHCGDEFSLSRKRDFCRHCGLNLCPPLCDQAHHLQEGQREIPPAHQWSQLQRLCEFGHLPKWGRREETQKA